MKWSIASSFRAPGRAVQLSEQKSVALEYLDVSLPQPRRRVWGRVVVGLQVPYDRARRVPEALDEIGYMYWDETG